MNARSDKSIESFYDDLAPDYDRMTGLAGRFAREEMFFRFLVKKHQITTAIDAGCGTGFHSLLLSRLNVKVTAVDLSREMLTRVKKHSRSYGLPITTVQSSFADLSEHIQTPVDGIFCMGNALAHNRTKKENLLCLANFHSLLRPRGVLVVQLLNYDRIVQTKEKVLHSRESDGHRYIRSYRYHGKSIKFMIDIETPKGKRSGRRTLSIPLHPLRSNELLSLLLQAGFSGRMQFGSIAKDPFSPASSRDLIVIAQKIPI